MAFLDEIGLRKQAEYIKEYIQNKLGDIDLSQLNQTYLGINATAANSSKLGGVNAANYAKLASPSFTGTPTAPTASVATNNTQIATTAFVRSAINTYGGSGGGGGEVINLTYPEKMLEYFTEANANNLNPTELTTLVTMWYSRPCDLWHGWVDFTIPSVSTDGDGTKGGDNAELECIPSTAAIENTDDYKDLPLFHCINCNFTVDPTTLEPVITAIEGITDSFEIDNPEKLVGVLQRTGYYYQNFSGDYERIGYCSEYIDGYNMKPLAEAVRPSNNAVRPWVVHSKYFAKVVNGKLVSCSGITPAFNMSYNNVRNAAWSVGTQYSGSCLCDRTFIQLMYWIKYGKRYADGILQGSVDVDLSIVKCAVSENNTNRLLFSAISSAYKVGMGVFVGTGAKTNASAYSLSGDSIPIKAIESVVVDNNTYTAVYFDESISFDTTANTTSMGNINWVNGTTDTVKGNDGAYDDPAGGIYPIKIQGIEFLVGMYEICTDSIAKYYQDSNDNNYYAELFYVDRSNNQIAASGSINSNYKSYGWKHLQGTDKDTMFYFTQLTEFNGVFLPTNSDGGSSSTSYKDMVQISGPTFADTRIAYYPGAIGDKAAKAGLHSLLLNRTIDTSYVGRSARISPNGNRGTFTPPTTNNGGE